MAVRLIRLGPTRLLSTYRSLRTDMAESTNTSKVVGAVNSLTQRTFLNMKAVWWSANALVCCVAL
jgi:hypothetical protein